MNGRNKNIDSYYYMIDHYHSLNSFKFKIILVCVDTKLPRLREGILKPPKKTVLGPFWAFLAQIWKISIFLKKLALPVFIY